MSLNTIYSQIDIIYKYYEDNLNYSHSLTIDKDIAKITNIETDVMHLLNKINCIKHSLHIKKNTIKKLCFNSSKTYDDNLNIDKNIHQKSCVIEVDSLEEIPEISLYYVNNISQYALNINGVYIRGNIGNIYSSHELQTKNPTDVFYCSYGNKCKKLLEGKICKKYHDPQETYEMYKSGIIDKLVANTQMRDRNFLNTFWMYSDDLKKATNKNMRHYNPTKDCNILEYNNNYYKHNFRDQCMHDILVYLLLCDMNIK